MPDFFAVLGVWLRWRRGFGWPHAGGWADQLAWVVEWIESCELARAEEAELSATRGDGEAGAGDVRDSGPRGRGRTR